MDYSAMRPYVTDRQAVLLDLLAEGITCVEAARRLGISERNARKLLKRAKALAAKRGYAPDHDMTKPVPDGFVVSGVSTYYNDEGKPTGQWVKSKLDAEDKLARLQEAIEDFLLRCIIRDFRKVTTTSQNLSLANH